MASGNIISRNYMYDPELPNGYQEADAELRKMQEETIRINHFLKDNNLCIHDRIKWTSKFEQLGKCQDCQEIKTRQEFIDDTNAVYEIIDEIYYHN